MKLTIALDNIDEFIYPIFSNQTKGYAMESNLESNEVLIWDITVPIFKETIILKQIAWTFWMPILLLFGAVSFLIRFGLEFMVVSGIILGASLLAQLLIFSFYGWNFKVTTTVNDKGIHFRPGLLDSPKWGTVKFLTSFFGVFSRRPGCAGAGILSGSPTGEMIPWEVIRGLNAVPARNLYVLKLSDNRRTVIFCLPENFEEIGRRYQNLLDKYRAESGISSL
jgi:hypothetical protein